MDRREKLLVRDVFTPEMAEDYWLTAAKGPEFFLHLGDYPKEIYLPDTWPVKLNQIRRNWQAEEVLVIGADIISRRVLLPISSIASGEHSVDSRLVELEKDRLVRDTGSNSHLGLIHGHPRDPVKINTTLTYNPQAQLKATLSCGDFYRQIYRGDLIMATVEYDQSLFSFASFETREAAVRFLKKTRVGFIKYWAKRNSFEYEPSNVSDSGEVLKPLNSEASLRTLNLDITRGLKLALYRGQADQKLVREYP